MQLAKKRQKETKAREKEAARQAKKARKDDMEQSSGRHANEELTVLIEGGMAKEAVGTAIIDGELFVRFC